MQLIVDEEHTGKRIDSVVAQMHHALSRSQVKKLVKLGSITVNGKLVKTSYQAAKDDLIEIDMEPFSKDALQPIDKPLSILYEDDNLLVIDKPQGLAMHPSEGPDDETLVNYLLSYCPSLQHVGDNPLRPGIVHRLDKLTSGIIVVAKNQTTFEQLKQAWKDGLVQKEYRALVWGDISNPGSLSAKIARSKRTGKMVIRKDEGKDVVTLYMPLERYTNATLVGVATHTGRTHQIRAHFKSIGQPVVGDPLYPDKKHRTTIIPRLFLHAYKLSFPYNGERKTVIAELPSDFTTYLNSLKKIHPVR